MRRLCKLLDVGVRAAPALHRSLPNDTNDCPCGAFRLAVYGGWTVVGWVLGRPILRCAAHPDGLALSWVGLKKSMGPPILRWAAYGPPSSEVMRRKVKRRARSPKRKWQVRRPKSEVTLPSPNVWRTLRRTLTATRRVEETEGEAWKSEVCGAKRGRGPRAKPNRAPAKSLGSVARAKSLR